MIHRSLDPSITRWSSLYMRVDNLTSSRQGKAHYPLRAMRSISVPLVPKLLAGTERGGHIRVELLFLLHSFSLVPRVFSCWCLSMETHSPIVCPRHTMDQQSCKLRRELILLGLMHMYLFILVSHCFHTWQSNEGDSFACIGQGRKLYGFCLL